MGSKVLTDMSPRLQAAALAVAGAQDALAAAREQRDELVVTAIDQGMSQRAVATAAGLSVPRVIAILAGSQPET